MDYHKIECPFNRSTEGNKEIIWGSYRNETVEFLKDIQYDFTEKVDGISIKICYNGYRVSIEGRTDKSIIPKFLYDALSDMFYTNEVEELFEQLFGDKEVILFGEGYGTKIQGVGKQYREDNGFILFDVMINGNYQSRKTVEEIAKAFGIDVVPIVLTGTLEDGYKYVMSHPTSVIAKDPTLYMEGVVARPHVELKDCCGNRIIVKIKWKDFKSFVK